MYCAFPWFRLHCLGLFLGLVKGFWTLELLGSDALIGLGHVSITGIWDAFRDERRSENMTETYRDFRDLQKHEDFIGHRVCGKQAKIEIQPVEKKSYSQLCNGRFAFRCCFNLELCDTSRHFGCILS